MRLQSALSRGPHSPSDIDVDEGRGCGMDIEEENDRRGALWIVCETPVVLILVCILVQQLSQLHKGACNLYSAIHSAEDFIRIIACANMQRRYELSHFVPRLLSCHLPFCQFRDSASQ
ncbi:hypothetical protein BT69DRAFT_1097679 [Atractiella rhizophila]|nr:hypothetical protein BT69DRAFT_1097679 [Atractiella rhizophila]